MSADDHLGADPTTVMMMANLARRLAVRGEECAREAEALFSQAEKVFFGQRRVLLLRAAEQTGKSGAYVDAGQQIMLIARNL